MATWCYTSDRSNILLCQPYRDLWNRQCLCQSTRGHDGRSLSPPWVSLQGCLLKTPVLTGTTCTGDALHMTGPRFHSFPCRCSFTHSPHSGGDIPHDSDVQTRKKILSPEKNWKVEHSSYMLSATGNLSPTHLKNKINAGQNHLEM